VDHNLRLFYLLAHCQVVALSTAARSLKISRPLIYNRILPENPCFLSELRSRFGWGSGGPERRIILSSQAKEYLPIIKALAKKHLGENECQRLKIEATRIRKGLGKSERKNQSPLDQIKSIYLKRRNDPEFRLEDFLPQWSKWARCSKEEINKFLGVGGA
jgi:hypothetical protein